MSLLSLIESFLPVGPLIIVLMGMPPVISWFTIRTVADASIFLCIIGKNLIRRSYTIFPHKIFKISPLGEEFYFLLEIETIFSVETMISVVSVVFTFISFGCCLDILEFSQ